MSRLAPAAWDDGAADENSLPFKNVAARQKQKKVGSRVDCGANAVSVRRKGLTENNSSGDSAQPVGRTTALPTTTVSNKDMEVPGLDDGCTDYHELATKVMPDRDEEWRMVLNTKVSAPKWETKKVVEQQVRLIGDLKKNIDVGRQQRAVFLERIKIVQRQLHTELSQLDNAQGACARADGLREQIAALETRLGSIEQETTEAVEKADAAEADLAEQRAALNSKEDELEENQTMLHEAKSAAASAQEDCVSELAGLKDKLEASVEAVAKLKASIADLETKIIKTEKDSSSALAAHEKELDAFGKKMAALDTECRELAAVATAAETEAKKLQSLQETNEATLASEQATLAECRTTMEQHKSAADTTEESLTAQEKDTQRLREEVVSLKKSQTSLTEETSSLHAQKDQLQTQNRQVANEMGDLQEKCDALSNEETKLTELNGRLETNIADNQGKTRQATAAAAEALQQYTEQSNAVAALSQQLSKDEAEQAAAEAEEAAQTAKHNELITEKENLTKLHDEFVAEKPVLLEKIKTGTVELEELRAKHGAAEKQQMAKLCTKQAEQRALQAQFDELLASVGAKRDKIQAVRDLIASQEIAVETKAKEAIENESLRRKLHNKMTELKGNIRVFCRVRPIKDSERLEGQLVDTVGCPAETGAGDKEMIELTAPGVNASNTGGEAQAAVEHSFGFDKVFPMQSTQEQVFEEVSTMVQSALDGYKVCIFAYGQTGSGKTHTMQGGEQPNTEGIIPRSIVHILNEARRLETQGWEYTMTANFLEIYNEEIRDLLRADGGGGAQAHRITHDSMGNTTVSNMTTVRVGSLEDVSDLMAKAETQRSVSATAMNSRSSRSHSVFTLRLSGRNESQGTALSGVLNLIDLAGSERLSKSEATGSRLKETQAINKSLSCLGSVFVALGKKSDHIPYRDSKLTYLLQSSLGGDGKTLMMLNLSPAPASYQESLCSLRFGSKVNTVDMGNKGRAPKREIHAITDQHEGGGAGGTERKRRGGGAGGAASAAGGEPKTAQKKRRGGGGVMGRDGSATGPRSAAGGKMRKQAWSEQKAAR